MPGSYEHPHYKYADEKDADAVAWVFTNTKKFVKFPFKFDALKPDEIRVNILYSGLCKTDSEYGRGKLEGARYPLCPGHEVVGEVAKVGTDCKTIRVGDKVAWALIRDWCGECKTCKKGKYNLCLHVAKTEKSPYGEYWGGYSTQIQAKEKTFWKIPEYACLERTPSIMCAAATVMGPIKEFAKTGDKCLVIGVGGLGHIAVKILAKMGYDVTGLTTSKDKADEIIGLGAKDVLLETDKEKWETLKNKFDFVLNCQCTFQNIDKSMELCAPECKYVTVGIESTYDKVSFGPCDFIWKDVQMIGSLNNTNPEFQLEVLEFCQKNDCYPEVELFDFEDFPKALTRLESGLPPNRIVVKVGEWAKAKGFFKYIYEHN